MKNMPPYLQKMKLIGCFVFIQLLCVNLIQAQESADFEVIFEKFRKDKVKNIKRTSSNLRFLKDNFEELSSLQKIKYRYYLAHSHALKGEHQSSILLLMDNIRSAKNKSWLAMSHSLLSLSYSFIGDYSKAFKNIRASMEILEDNVTDKYTFLSIHQHAFNLYSGSELLSEALDISHKMGKAAGENLPYWNCASYINMAVVEIKIRKLSMAEKFAEKAIKVCDLAKVSLSKFYAIELKSQIHLLRQSPQKGLDLLLENENEAKAIGYAVMNVRYDISISESYQQQGRYDLALESALKAYLGAEKLNDKTNKERSAKLLAIIYSKQGKYEEAVEYYNQMMELKRKLNLQIKQRKLAYFENKSFN